LAKEAHAALEKQQTFELFHGGSGCQSQA
jgi:hypothetical protein